MWFIFKILLFWCNCRPKFADVDENFRYDIVRILLMTPGEDQNILDSQNYSWDFAENIVNFLEICFQQVIKTLEKNTPLQKIERTTIRQRKSKTTEAVANRGVDADAPGGEKRRPEEKKNKNVEVHETRETCKETCNT